MARGAALAGAFCAAACNAQSPTDTKPVGELASLGPQQPARVLHATVIGRVPADQRIDFVLGLRLGRGDDGALARHLLRARDQHSADYGTVLTPAQFGDRFAISQGEYDSLCAKLEGMGLTISQRTPSRSTVSVFGPAGIVEQLFGTELLVYRDAPTSVSVKRNESDTFYAPSASFSFASFGELSNLVVGVTGLDDAGRWQSHMRPGQHLGGSGPRPASFTTAQGSADLRTRYNVIGANGPNGQLSGAGETIVLLGAGYPPISDDLDGFVKHEGLGDWRTHYIQAPVGGASRDSVTRSENEQGENTLDADMALGIAPNASVVHVMVASNAPGLFSDGITFVLNQVPQAHQVSVSYGTCERVAIYETNGINALFMQAIAQGQTWFFSSGDNGTDTCQDADPSAVLSVDWPASSPYVFGVGGTQLNKTTGAEEVWGVGGSGGAGGGGQSELFPKPSWQVGIGPFPNDGARDVPDVAALAGDPGVYVYESGDTSVEGTSAASPIFASIWSMLNEARNHKAPPIHDDVYGQQKAGAGMFTDITVGNNSDGNTPGYDAEVGYDCATGWGTPLLNKLVGALP